MNTSIPTYLSVSEFYENSYLPSDVKILIATIDRMWFRLNSAVEFGLTTITEANSFPFYKYYKNINYYKILTCLLNNNDINFDPFRIETFIAAITFEEYSHAASEVEFDLLRENKDAVLSGSASLPENLLKAFSSLPSIKLTTIPNSFKYEAEERSKHKVSKCINDFEPEDSHLAVGYNSNGTAELKSSSFDGLCETFVDTSIENLMNNDDIDEDSFVKLKVMSDPFEKYDISDVLLSDEDNSKFCEDGDSLKLIGSSQYSCRKPCKSASSGSVTPSDYNSVTKIESSIVYPCDGGYHFASNILSARIKQSRVGLKVWGRAKNKRFTATVNDYGSTMLIGTFPFLERNRGVSIHDICDNLGMHAGSQLYILYLNFVRKIKLRNVKFKSRTSKQ